MRRFHINLGLCAGVVLASTFALVAHSRAQDDSEPAAKKNEKPTAESDPLAVPEQATAQELEEFVQKVQAMRPRSVEQLLAMQEALLKASDQLLAMPDLPADTAVAAVEAKLQALTYKARLGVEGSEQQLKATAEKLQNDKRPQVASKAREQLLILRIQKSDEMSVAEQKQLLDDVIAKIQKESPTKENFGLGVALGEVFESYGKEDVASLTYKKLAELAKSSKDEDVVEYAKVLEGVARRLGLPGNTMQIVGSTIEGEKFNWDAYRGKVVLVDFWATWCGPCLQEMPNVKANYDKYHDKGFDVVGISLDDDKDALMRFLAEEKAPWTTVWNAGHPNAEHYGISAIPTVILVDKEGKVVSMNARGPELGRLLKELLGEAKKTEPEKTEKP